MTKTKTETPKQMNEDSTTSKMRKALEATLAAFKSGAIHTCSYCYRDEWEDELNYLKDDVELALEAKPQPPFNVAAMRETLVWIRSLGLSYPDLNERIDAALTASPRNCDRFNTEDVVKDVDDALREIVSNGQDKCPRDVVKWLLKSAEEKNHEL